jgi:phosphoribosylaminoimidazole-succinocarboxamide synthase
MKKYTYAVNEVLTTLFAQAGLILVDYKLEFGRYQNTIILGDEFSPDGCRIWDAKTKKVLDKDRFRKEMGDVIEAYEEVAQRLGITLPVSA